MARPLRTKDILPIGSGLLTALAMPGFGVWPLALVSLVPLFLAFRDDRPFRAGFLFGLTFFLIDLRWLVTLVRFHPIVIPGFVLLCIGYGLLLGAVGWLASHAARKHATWGYLVVAPSALIIAEILRALGPFALGFSTLYSSLHTAPAMIQLARWLGPYAVSWVIAAINGGLALLAVRRRIRYAIPVVGLVALLLLPSVVPRAPDVEVLDVAVISSTVKQETKLDARNLDVLRERYRTLGVEAAASDPDLIVFPESIIPTFILRHPDALGDLQGLARRSSARILFGTGDYVDGNLFNRVVSLSPSGAIEATYDMVRLVPFGEYIPGRSLLDRLGLEGMLRSVLPRDVTPGPEHVPVMDMGTPICFESTFPTAARRFTQAGAEFHVIVTNDAWFDDSSELVAHAASAVFRAVETDRWIAQSANGGVSGIVSPDGRFVASTTQEEVVFSSIGRRTTRTLYVRAGDLPIVVCCAVGVALELGFACTEIRRKRKRKAGG